MNILIVSQYFWPESFIINDMARRLAERGHGITVLTGIPNYPEGAYYKGYGPFRNTRQEYCGARIIRVPLAPRGGGGALRLAFNYASFAVCASMLGPVLCRGKYDAIFVFEPSPITVALPAILMKYAFSSPVALWVQDLWPESISAAEGLDSEPLMKAVGKLVKFIYRHCDLILVQSRAFMDSIAGMGVEREKIVYFPNSSPDTFQDNAAGRYSGLPEMPEGFRLMFAGNVGAAQDFATILGAAEKLKNHPEIHWIIVGSGRQLPWVQSQVKQRGLSGTVHLLGRHPVEAMPQFFALADSMLVTLKKSRIFSLTIPSKVQSYLAGGKPIIAALDGEGARVISEAGAGLTCPAEDSGALAQMALDMSRMAQAERESMGRSGRAYYEANFDQEMLLDRFEHLMDGRIGRAVRNTV
jgi:glycosyltransferase involved in cell wall biosynthesis